jgi:hypothetical protein
MPCHGSRILSLFVVGFLALGWSGFAGQSMGWLLQSVGAEVANPIQIGVAALAVLGVNLFFGLFAWVCVLDHSWSFEPHRATRRLNVLGVPVRARTYHVIDATGGPDSLVLRSTNSRDVAVRPSGWGSETDETLMPAELRRLIRTYLAIPPVPGLPDPAQAGWPPRR